MGQGPDVLQGHQAGRHVGHGWQGWAAGGAGLGTEHFGAFDWKQMEGLPMGTGPAASQQDWGGGDAGVCPSLVPTGCVRGNETAPLLQFLPLQDAALGGPQPQKVAMSCKCSNWATLIV